MNKELTMFRSRRSRETTGKKKKRKKVFWIRKSVELAFFPVLGQFCFFIS